MFQNDISKELYFNNENMFLLETYSRICLTGFDAKVLFSVLVAATKKCST